MCMRLWNAGFLHCAFEGGMLLSLSGREGMRLFPDIVLYSEQGGFNEEMGKGVATKMLPQLIWPLWGRNTIPIDGVDGEAPEKAGERGPFQCDGRPYPTMGDGC